jgi:FkbM family methyltransferase
LPTDDRSGANVASSEPLIFDIGMSEGSDTDFYLRKGFRVVGVEADALVCESGAQRFAECLQEGRLTIVNRAAAYSDSEKVVFWRDKKIQGHSSLFEINLSEDTQEILVETISYPTLCNTYGIPYYVKIDIGGGEPPFIRSFGNSSRRPQYVSAECRNFEPIDILADLGYRYFKLVNQAKLAEFVLPNPPREGRYAERPASWACWSGPFGRELPGQRWFSHREIRTIWRQLHELWTFETLIVGWFDCHACCEVA